MGIGLDGPAPDGTVWLEQTWNWENWSFFAHAESAILPLSFGRLNLKLTWSPKHFKLSPELVLLDSGQADFLFTSKTGWIGLNIAPTPILVTWGFFSGELRIDGPPPWCPTLKIQIDPWAEPFPRLSGPKPPQSRFFQNLFNLTAFVGA